MPVFAEGGQNINEPGQSGESDITANIAASNFDVTVPLGLPLYLHSDGSVTTATDAKIENNSQGPIIVKNVKLTPVDNWKLASFTDDYKIKKVNSNELGFQIMNENVLVDGSVDMQAEDWPSIPGNSNIPLTYDGRVPVRSSDGVMIAANLELTLDWDKDNLSVYPDKMYLGLGLSKDIKIISKPEKNSQKTALAVNPLLLTAVQSETLDNNVTFSSSDESIATVDQNGKVTGIKPGSVVITAEADDNEDFVSVTVVNASVSTTEGGEATLTQLGNRVTFAATAHEGYSFVNWTDANDEVVSDEALFSFELTKSVALRANFKKNNYNVNLTVNKDGAGTVTGGGTYLYNDEISIEAKPLGEYTFVSWSDGDTNAKRNITVKNDMNLIAIFEKEHYGVSVVNDGHGEAYIDTESKPTIGSYSYGEEITFANVPDEGYHFVNYTDQDDNIVSNPYTVVKDITIKANFVQNDKYKVTVNKVGDGEVTGGGEYEKNENITLTASPAEHYHFIDWKNDDNTTVSNDPSYNTTVTGNITYTAYFDIDQFTVTLTSGTGGNITGASSGTYDYGTELDITAVPDDGYKFTKWSDNDTNASKTITVTENINLSAEFEENVSGHQSKPDFYYDGLKYNLYSDGTASVAENPGVSGDITISRTVVDDNGFEYTVTAVGDNAFNGCSELKNVTIPDSVTVIAAKAFWMCSGLQGVNIPNTVVSIGDWAFDLCTSLSDLVIPTSMTYIGNNAFYGMTGSQIILIEGKLNRQETIDAGWHSWWDKGCSAIINYLGDNQAEDGFGSQYSVNTNSDGTYNITKAYPTTTDIVLPEKIYGVEVTSISGDAFNNTQGKTITSVVIPKTIKSIGKEIFIGCNSLMSITVDPENQYYSSNNGVLFNKDKSELVKYTQGNTSTDYTVLNSVKVIGDNAFKNCTYIENVILPSSITSIGNNAFEHCTGMTSINLPNGLQSIGDSVFYECYHLTNITIPASVTYVGEDAFASWTSNQYVNIEGKANRDSTIAAGWNEHWDITYRGTPVYNA